ncbi:MAG: pyrimidine operon attenuation protein/uracil phosphoribosyltransferase [Candidatus Pelagisphaera sp.]
MPIRKSIQFPEIESAIDSIAAQIANAHTSTSNLVLAAIANGGIALTRILGRILAEKYGIKTHSATIDISFHRDDIGVNPIAKEVESTELIQDPEESTIILVDDVIFSGRSIRAAMAEVHAIGRPRKIELVALIDRGNRLLPIQADYVGIEAATSTEEKVVVELDSDELIKSRIDILSA